MQQPQKPRRPARTRPAHLPALLTVAEVASVLRVHEATVYRACAEGRLRAVQLGGLGSTVRIPADALEELLEARSAAESTRRRPRSTPQPKEAA